MDKTIEKFRVRRDARVKERMDAKFEENEHPRDENGRFTSGGGSSGGSKRGKEIPFAKNRAERGGVEKTRQERGGVARKMSMSGEIPQDVMGQLDSHNYSDEIIDRAVERKWITEEQAQKIRSGGGGGKVEGAKTEAASARERMISKSKEGAKPEGGPAPKRVKPDYGSGEAAEKAIAKGRALRDLDRQELVDIAEAYGIKTDRYTKPGSFAKNSEIVEDILSARRKASAGRKSEQSSDKEVKATPRPKTKLEVMKGNKDNYAKAQSEVKNMKPGLERDVKEKLILPWIKGDNWMGGINDRKFSDIAKKMPYDFDTIYDEFQKQMMKY